jgi:hypothetical protein
LQSENPFIAVYYLENIILILGASNDTTFETFKLVSPNKKMNYNFLYEWVMVNEFPTEIEIQQVVLAQNQDEIQFKIKYNSNSTRLNRIGTFVSTYFNEDFNDCETEECAALIGLNT